MAIYPLSENRRTNELFFTMMTFILFCIIICLFPRRVANEEVVVDCNDIPLAPQSTISTNP